MPWIRRINRLSRPEKEGLYRMLIPPSLFSRFGIDPLSMCDNTGRKAVRFFGPNGDRTSLVEVKLAHQTHALYSIQLSDTGDYTQLGWDFLVVNDPASPTFDTHIDTDGKDTLFGWASRNRVEEQKAMEAGLFPGQVAKGLGLSREIVHVLESFCRLFDMKSIRLEALFYHNAVTYERYGFSYFEGYALMKRIHESFQPGNKLHQLLNDSTPFRKPEFAHTVRGRSWAIHDGILNDTDDDELRDGWESPVMYRMMANPRGMVTFPEPKY